MPPYIEADSHHHDNDCQVPTDQPKPALVTSTNNDELPSPLFRDNTITTRTNFGLDRRLSDPNNLDEGKEVILKDEPAKQVVAPIVSRITAIIGPESAYVKTAKTVSSPTATKGVGATTATKSSSSSSSTVKQQKQQTQKQQPLKKSMNKTKDQKTDTTTTNKKPVYLRASRYVSKKGWKVVKSLPNKLVSTARSTCAGSVKVPKVPGNHRNVI